MNYSFDKLMCGPRSIMIMAARMKRPIDPEALWNAFHEELSRSSIRACSVSLLLDMARRFNLARHFDVTHDLDRVGQAFVTSDVAGVLMTFERERSSTGRFVPRYHVEVVLQKGVDSAGVLRIAVESAQAGQATNLRTYPATDLASMMSSFLIFYDIPTLPT